MLCKRATWFLLGFLKTMSWNTTEYHRISWNHDFVLHSVLCVLCFVLWCLCHRFATFLPLFYRQATVYMVVHAKTELCQNFDRTLWAWQGQKEKGGKPKPTARCCTNAAFLLLMLRLRSVTHSRCISAKSSQRQIWACPTSCHRYCIPQRWCKHRHSWRSLQCQSLRCGRCGRSESWQ